MYWSASARPMKAENTTRKKSHARNAMENGFTSQFTMKSDHQPRRLPAHVADGGEIHLHHHGRNHEPDQDRNGRVDLAALAEFQAAKGLHNGGHQLPEGNPRHHRGRGLYGEPAVGRQCAVHDRDGHQDAVHRARVKHYAAAGFTARMKALMNLPSTSDAMASTSMPLPERNSRASSMR